MKAIFFKIFFLGCFMLWMQNAFAYTEIPHQSKQTATLTEASDGLKARLLPPSSLDQYKESEDFVYTRIDERPKPTLWDRFKAWLLQQLGKLFFGNSVAVSFWELLPYAVGLVAIVLIVFHMSNTPILSIFGRSDRKTTHLKIEEENLEELDLDALLSELLAKVEYRAAVRIHFLKVLKRLSEKGIIQWKVEKTNDDYAKELPIEMVSTFRQLVNGYEYVWYGNFSLNLEEYEALSARFSLFEKEILKVRVS